MIQEKFKGSIEKKYEAPLYSIFSKVVAGLAGRKITQPARDFESHHSAKGVKCSVKASEGILFCLEKAFMFVPKPSQYIPYDAVSVVVMSRVGGAISASRTFDITLELRGGGEYQFSNINREEQKPLEDFFEVKSIRVRNEMVDDSSSLLKKALNDEPIGSDDDVAGEDAADRGSAADDSEEADDDFQSESDSEVAEEFDSEHESSGSGSEEGGEQSDPEERPKKKAKTGK